MSGWEGPPPLDRGGPPRHFSTSFLHQTHVINPVRNIRSVITRVSLSVIISSGISKMAGTPPMTPPGQIRRSNQLGSPPPIQPANAPIHPNVPIVQALFQEEVGGPVFPPPPPFPPPPVNPVAAVGDPVGLVYPHSVQHPPTAEFHNAVQDVIAAVRDLEDMLPGWHLSMHWRMEARLWGWNVEQEVTGTGTWDNPIVIQDDEDPAADDEVIDLTQ